MSALIALGIVCVLFSIPLFLVTAYKVFKDRATRHWLKTEGKIVTSEADVDEMQAKGLIWIIAKIEYKYWAKGKEYLGNRVYPSKTSGKYLARKKAEAAIYRYSIDSSVTVYYNPNKVDETVLEPVVQKFIPIVLGSTGCLFLAMAIYAFSSVST